MNQGKARQIKLVQQRSICVSKQVRKEGRKIGSKQANKCRQRPAHGRKQVFSTIRQETKQIYFRINTNIQGCREKQIPSQQKKEKLSKAPQNRFAESQPASKIIRYDKTSRFEKLPRSFSLFQPFDKRLLFILHWVSLDFSASVESETVVVIDESQRDCDEMIFWLDVLTLEMI